jgi:hypothetical protein
MFRIVFWDVLLCKMIVDRRFTGAYCLHHPNHFTRQYIPEDNSEHHTRRRENLKSHIVYVMFVMGEVELGQDFIRVIRVLSYQYHSTAAPYSFLYRLGMDAVQQQMCRIR